MKYLVDTNVLLRWVHRNDPRHAVAVAAVDNLRASNEELLVAAQNVLPRPMNMPGSGAPKVPIVLRTGSPLPSAGRLARMRPRDRNVHVPVQNGTEKLDDSPAVRPQDVPPAMSSEAAQP